MRNRLDHTIEEKIKSGKKVFVGYLTGGDPSPRLTSSLVLALQRGGIDVVEIGIPFSDPVGDGPVNQSAAHRALTQGTTPEDVLKAVSELRTQSQIPVVLFTYLNPIIAMGEENFFKKAKTVGPDGVLVVDLPVEESEKIYNIALKNEIHLIYLASPTTSNHRLKQIEHFGGGFLYYACWMGTTGVRGSTPPDLDSQLERIHSIVNLPVFVGFGIATRQSALAATKNAEGFVVGSAFGKVIEKYHNSPELLERLTQVAKNISLNGGKNDFSI